MSFPFEDGDVEFWACAAERRKVANKIDKAVE
jgi:hypothetical protein